MSSETLQFTPELSKYLHKVSLREPPVLKRLRQETLSHPYAAMQICPEQGQLMALLVRLLNARLTLEVGVFTGYSSLVTALALPEDGRIVACDISDEYTSIARKSWREAGVERKSDLRLAPALETLDSLLSNNARESFDLAFIDADKVYYPAYYDRCFKLVRSGGLILVDNVLWGGRVADSACTDQDTQGIRELSRTMHTDERIDLSMIPIGDGLTIARKH